MSINLEKEIIDGYEVSSDTKQLWNAELSILSEIDRICTKHNIKYFADWGTLLGAVRHKGFIPWDDDLDISMLIEDYEKFVSVAAEELRKPYFLQTIDTEKNFSPWHIKVRKSDTTGATQWEIANAPSWNKGIFIDIFPLYPITDDPKRLERFRKKLAKKRQLLYRISKYCLRKTSKNVLGTLIYGVFDYKKECQSFINLCKTGGLRSGETTSSVSITSFRSDKDAYIAKKEWYETVIYMPFMDRTVPAPIGYKGRLTALYGDYMTPVKGTAGHSGILFDASVPYTEKLKNKNP